jgi:ABC-type branched-subunit amino acid transport system ATPase component
VPDPKNAHGDHRGGAVRSDASATSPLLRATGLGVRDGEEWLFRGLDLSVHAGEGVALLAEQGLSRTAAVLTLAGRLAADEGDLAVGDVPADGRRGAARVRKAIQVGWVPGRRLFEDRARVSEVLDQARRLSKSGARAHGSLSRDDELDLLGLSGRGYARAGALPATIKSALGALAVAHSNPQVIAMDLPAGSAAQEKVAAEVIGHLGSRGIALLVASQHGHAGTVRSVELPAGARSERVASA